MKNNIKDVARHAGVSIATVSHVINNTHYVSEEKRRKILNAIEGLNYQPNLSARNLRTRKVSHVGIYICEEYSFLNPNMLNRMLKFLIETIETRGWQPLIHYITPRTISACMESMGDCIFSLLITFSQDNYNHINFTEKKLFILNMDKSRLSLLRRGEREDNQFHYAGHYYYTALANYISDNIERNICFLMTREDYKTLLELYSDNVNYKLIFTRIKIIYAEMPDSTIELNNLLQNNIYEQIYITDYKFAMNTIRHLLLNHELVSTRTDIFFFNYDYNFESLNGFMKNEPFFLSRTNIDEIVSHATAKFA